MMENRKSQGLSYSFSILFSLICHLLLAVIVVVTLEASAANAPSYQEVFTVTLEGGQKLGGITQVPSTDPKGGKAQPNKVVPPSVPSSVPKEEITKKIEQPTIVENLESEIRKKQAEEKKIRELEEKKLLERKKAEELKKKQEEDAKRKAEEEKQKKIEQEKKLEAEKKEAELKKAQEAEEQKKKAAEEEKKKLQAEIDKKKKAEEDAKKAAAEKAAREEKLQQAISKFSGDGGSESYNAGGQGLGAARLGGNGTGGGILASAEFIAYRNQLESHIKQGWRWLPGDRVYQTVVGIVILPTGQIQDATIESSSGNKNFDESALRAVWKASPVPPAPESLYEKFRQVRITFDSHK